MGAPPPEGWDRLPPPGATVLNASAPWPCAAPPPWSWAVPALAVRAEPDRTLGGILATLAGVLVPNVLESVLQKASLFGTVARDCFTTGVSGSPVRTGEALKGRGACCMQITFSRN